MLSAWPNMVFWVHSARGTSPNSTILPAPLVNIFLNIVRASTELKLFNVGYQRSELMRDANGDYSGPVGSEGRFESRLDFLCRVSGHSDTTKSLGGGDNIESGQIKRGHIGSFLENRKFFENQVLVVARDNIDELEFLPSSCIKALYGILESSIPDGRDDRTPGSQFLLGNRNADRRPFSPSQSTTRKGVVRTGLVDWPVLGGIPEVGSCLVHQDGICGPQLA